jgi:hypothetical protein
MQLLPDPLGVRESSRFVMDRARDVRIDQRQVNIIAGEIVQRGAIPQATSWTEDHLGDIDLSDTELANFVLVLDTLNYYFWGEPRWTVQDNESGTAVNGYQALAVALRRALRDGYPITDAHYLATIPSLDLARILRGESVIPWFASRVQNLRETGQTLCREYDGEFFSCIKTHRNNGPALVRALAGLFPSFVDVRRYDSRAIPFYKRAQILTGDLNAAFSSRGVTLFDDLTFLTAFADYKVPHVLHQLGALQYSPELEQKLLNLETIPEGDPLEVEIRAATIVAVDNIMLSTIDRGVPVPAAEIDWYLWNLGQQAGSGHLPYHRTPTIAY